MKRVLFLVRERTGSTFLTAMLFGVPGRADNKWGGEVNNNPRYLPTVPAKQCLWWYHGNGKNILSDVIRKRTSIREPEAYMWSAPSELDRAFFDSLPEADEWKFIYLLRDPRNRIESVAEAACLSHPDLEFKERVRSAQTRISAAEMRTVLAMIDDPRFYILRFESLIADPLSALTDMYRFMGFQLDPEFYQTLIEEQVSTQITSSFNNDEICNVNSRWASWTSKERQYFDSLCGNELIQLGYSNDHSWVYEESTTVQVAEELDTSLELEEISKEEVKVDNAVLKSSQTSIEEPIEKEKPKRRGRKTGSKNKMKKTRKPSKKEA